MAKVMPMCDTIPPLTSLMAMAPVPASTSANVQNNFAVIFDTARTESAN
jgi:hypothetical protein